MTKIILTYHRENYRIATGRSEIRTPLRYGDKVTFHKIETRTNSEMFLMSFSKIVGFVTCSIKYSPGSALSVKLYVRHLLAVEVFWITFHTPRNWKFNWEISILKCDYVIEVLLQIVQSVSCNKCQQVHFSNSPWTFQMPSWALRRGSCPSGKCARWHSPGISTREQPAYSTAYPSSETKIIFFSY